MQLIDVGLCVFGSFQDIWGNAEWPRFWPTLYNTNKSIGADMVCEFLTSCDIDF